ncbi:MAG: 50S ribosomal protein L33 [Candidatus Marinimicrobia bacterium]|nr:50S ribosomal protein L33 [Candidatus Neomarinimicrobiota bacterium]
MGGKSKRNFVTLECTDCHRRNYSTTKNKRKHPERITYKKYCPWCQSHSLHKETK